MNDLRFYALFNISFISGRWTDDNETLCAMEPCLRLKRSQPQVGIEPGAARSVGQRLTHSATGAPNNIGTRPTQTLKKKSPFWQYRV